jgi:hypothetical protein
MDELVSGGVDVVSVVSSVTLQIQRTTIKGGRDPCFSF